jgi:hypothetical protein
VFDGLLARGRIGVAQAAEFVRQRLARLVLEGVRIDAIEAQPEAGRMLAQFAVIGGLVPREVRRHRRRGACQLMHHAAIGDLVEHIARLADAGETGKTRTARTYAPAGERHGERSRLRLDHIDIQLAAGQLLAQRSIVLAHGLRQRRIARFYYRGGN